MGSTEGLMGRVGERRSRYPAAPLSLAGALTLLLVSLSASFLGEPRRVATARSEHLAAHPSILVISVDTLRRDRLGCYGYAEARTPNIDTLAQQSAVFDDATSPIPLTGPSHVTMLTGRYPTAHGVEANGVRIPAQSRTVAEALRSAGYSTAAFVSGWTLRNEAVGLADRFDHYDDMLGGSWAFANVLDGFSLGRAAVRAAQKVTGYELLAHERLGVQTTERALSWLAAQGEQPFFAVVHYFDTHGPHIRPSPSAISGAVAPAFDYRQAPRLQRAVLADPARVKETLRAYDDEIAYVDSQVGALLTGLDRLGRRDDTFVVFTADHGESLTEHGWYFDHGEFVYETCVRVPLLIRFPDRRYAGIRWARQVRLVDLAPTILELGGIDSDLAPVDGESVLAILEGNDTAARASFGSIRQGNGDESRARYYVRANGYKLIWNFDGRERVWRQPAYEEIYELTSDPNEERNLVGAAPPALAELRRTLRAWIPEDPRRMPEPAGDVRERLHALGYL